MKLTKAQCRQLAWLLLGAKDGDAQAPANAAAMSAMIRAVQRGERPADPARLGGFLDLMVELESQVRSALADGPGEPKAKKESRDDAIPVLSPDEIRARLTAHRTIKVHVDGACKGNPGPAGIGFVFLDAAGNVLHEDARFVGQATNNEAEYLALTAALEEALRHGVRRLAVYTDSRLMAGHLTGEFAVKTPSILPFVKRAAELRRQFEYFEIFSIPREQNHHADRLSNIGVRKGDAATA